MPLSDHQMKKGQQPKPISEEKYHELIECFRENGRKYTVASRQCSCSVATAKKAWLEGWPERGWPAIKAVLKDESLLARSRRAAEKVTDVLIGQEEALAQQAEEEARARLKAREDAIQARAQEAKMVALARANTIGLQSVTARLLRAGIREATNLDEQLQKGEVQLSPKDRLSFMAKVGYLCEAAARCAETTIKMERQLLGEPTEVLGIAVKDMSLDEASRTVLVANRALRRAAARGLIPPDAVEAMRREFMAGSEPIDVDFEEVSESIEAQAEAVLGKGNRGSN